MRNVFYLLLEAVIAGVVTIIVGYSITKILTQGEQPDENSEDFGLMILNYFLIGSMVHLSFEIAGLNKLFCEVAYPSKVVVPEYSMFI